MILKTEHINHLSVGIEKKCLMNRTDEHIADKPNSVGLDIYCFANFWFEASTT